MTSICQGSLFCGNYNGKCSRNSKPYGCLVLCIDAKAARQLKNCFALNAKDRDTHVAAKTLLFRSSTKGLFCKMQKFFFNYLSTLAKDLQSHWKIANRIILIICC